MRTNRGIPLNRAGLLNPFVDYLGRMGAPVERNLEREGLPIHALENPDTLISARRHMSFVGSMRWSQGIEDLGWRVAQQAETGPIGTELRHAIVKSPTLYEALLAVCSLVRRESTQTDMWMTESAGAVHLFHRGTFVPGTPGQDELSLWRVRTLLAIIRLYAGKDWTPDEACFALAKDPGVVVREALRDCRIYRAPDCGWITIPRSILSQAPPQPIEAPVDSKDSRVVRDHSADLVASLKQLLRPYLYEAVPKVDEAAAMAGLHRRTFQRRLREAQVSYRDVVRQTRFEAAKRILEDPTNRIMDVAHEVGFDDFSHFSRFFRSIAGVTPTEFRRSLNSGP